MKCSKCGSELPAQAWPIGAPVKCVWEDGKMETGEVVSVCSSSVYVRVPSVAGRVWFGVNRSTGICETRGLLRFDRGEWIGMRLGSRSSIAMKRAIDQKREEMRARRVKANARHRSAGQ